MNHSYVCDLLERQLLLQLGDRLRRLRKANGLGTVEMSLLAGITRNTLRSIEAGDPAPSIGNYMRVMSVLGVSGEMALLAGDSLVPSMGDAASGRSRRMAPVVSLHISTNEALHQIQDLQSLTLHAQAVKKVKFNPILLQQVQETLSRWLSKEDSRSYGLWLEWKVILQARAWRKVLGRSNHSQQLRQASPLVTILSEDERKHILMQVSDLKKGVDLKGKVQIPTKELKNKSSV
jgi:transcriptional regulator with XRE-family HTH domain